MTALVPLVLAVALLGRQGTPDPPASTEAGDPMAVARVLATREDWPEAVEAFRGFLRHHPDAPEAPEARFWVGFCRVKLGEDEAAIEALRPFESTLADDKWADDALLHLGHAYRDHDERDLAVAAWKRLRDKYPDSVWRGEATVQIIEVLFQGAGDYAACFPYCERLVEESTDSDATARARFAGAYCLGELKRFDDAERWEGRWLDRGDAHEEALRRVLAAQRDLIRGKVEAAVSALTGLDGEFPDLDEGSHLDALLQATGVLCKHGKADKAREMLRNELKRPSKHAGDDFDSILDRLEEAYGKDRQSSFLNTLNTLANDGSVPMVARVALRERQAQALCRDGKADRAGELLRETLNREPAEFARVKAALKLADILANDRNDPPGAIKVLDELLPKLKRRDFAHEVRAQLARYRSQAKVAGG